MAIEMVLLAAGSLGTLAAVVIGWKHLQHLRREPPEPSVQDSRSFHAVDASSKIGSVNILTPGSSRRRSESAPYGSQDAPIRSPEQRRPIAPGPRQVTEEVDEYVEVEAGTYGEFHVPLSQGDSIKGMVREQDGYEFDFYIMDEENFVAFSENEEWEGIYFSEDRGTHRVDAEIPHDDVWYFVFEVYGKQYTREIEASLRWTKAD